MIFCTWILALLAQVSSTLQNRKLWHLGMLDNFDKTGWITEVIMFLYFIDYLVQLHISTSTRVVYLNIYFYAHTSFASSYMHLMPIFILLTTKYGPCQERLSWHFSFQRIILINHQLCALFLECFILIVSAFTAFSFIPFNFIYMWYIILLIFKIKWLHCFVIFWYKLVQTEGILV